MSVARVSGSAVLFHKVWFGLVNHFIPYLTTRHRMCTKAICYFIKVTVSRSHFNWARYLWNLAPSFLSPLKLHNLQYNLASPSILTIPICTYITTSHDRPHIHVWGNHIVTSLGPCINIIPDTIAVWVSVISVRTTFPARWCWIAV